MPVTKKTPSRAASCDTGCITRARSEGGPSAKSPTSTCCGPRNRQWKGSGKAVRKAVDGQGKAVMKAVEGQGKAVMKCSERALKGHEKAVEGHGKTVEGKAVGGHG